MTDALTLPTWPPFTNPFFSLAARCLNEWIALGATDRVGYGMIANHEAECAFKISAVGDKGRAFGLGQWWSPRIETIRAGTGIDVRTEPLIERHVQAAYWELTKGPYQHAWKAICASQTASEAAQLACKMWEGAGAPNAMQRRGAMATRWEAFFAEHQTFLAQHPAQN